MLKQKEGEQVYTQKKNILLLKFACFEIFELLLALQFGSLTKCKKSSRKLTSRAVDHFTLSRKQ